MEKKTMKAAVFYDKGDVRIEEVPIPVPGPNQMLVKINFAGMCGSDAEIYQNGSIHKLDGPMILGHEKVGTVVEVGEGVKYSVGARLLLGPPGRCAQGCPPCDDGRTSICLHAVKATAGLGGPNGGYAEYMLVEDVAHTILVELPDQVTFEDAVLADVFCVPLHAIRRSCFKFGDNVVVSGSGAIGLACISMLKAAGANKIVALGTTNSKFDMIREYGADLVLNPNECEDLEGEIKKFFNSEVTADVSFECVGSNPSLRNCLFKTTKPGGQVVTLGAVKERMDVVQEYVNNREIDMRTSFVYGEKEVKIFLEMLQSKKLYIGPMVSKKVSLDDCVAGLTKEGRVGTLRILIDPSL